MLMADPVDILLGAGGNLISSVGSALFGNALGRANEEKMWNERYSPQAQVRNLAAAGINPAVAMGNQSPVLTSGGQINPVPVSPFGIGTTGLAELGSYLKAAADAKKAGVDTRSAEEDIKLKQIEQSRNQFELKLRQQYGLKQAAQDLSLAEANVRLAQLSGDNAEMDKAIKEYTKAKEKALSECQEKQRDILQKELDNKDTELKLSNRVLKTQGDSNIASANASNAAAGLAKAQTKTEDATRDYKAFAIDLANHMQGLEYGFNLDTYQQRLEKFAHDVGIAKWTEFMQSVEAKDRAAYNAVQRIIMGKGTKEDGKTFWNLINDGRQFIPFK